MPEPWKVQGTSLGGWLVLEPWLTPSLFYQFLGADVKYGPDIEKIKEKTAIRDRMGAMPPWYMEKDIGIQEYKQDPSLTDHELALIQAWADNGAPEGDPADLMVDLNPVLTMEVYL